MEGAARPQFTQCHARSHDAAEKPQERLIGTVIFTTVHSRGHGLFNWLDHRILFGDTGGLGGAIVRGNAALMIERNYPRAFVGNVDSR